VLFYVAWHPCAGQTAEQQKKGLETFARWAPPKGLEFKGFYARADGRGGLCICEADSAETILTAVAPWAGVHNDYDLIPILPIEKSVEILNAAIAFRGA
jgi:hypothetical protein